MPGGPDDSDDASGDDDDSAEDPREGGDYADADRWERDERAQEHEYARPRYSEPARSPELEMRFAQRPPPPQPPSLSTHPGGPNGAPYPPMRERDEMDVYAGRSRANTASTTSSVGGEGHYLGAGEHRALGHLPMLGVSANGLQLPPIQPHGDGRPSTGNSVSAGGVSAGNGGGAQKRRASETVFVKGHRPPAAGSKVVACNFCRGKSSPLSL